LRRAQRHLRACLAHVLYCFRTENWSRAVDRGAADDVEEQRVATQRAIDVCCRKK